MIHENVIITVCYSLAVGWQHLMPLASLLSFCAVLVLISSLLAQGKSRRRGRKDDGEPDRRGRRQNNFLQGVYHKARSIL
jgi:hypothetical protein